MLPPETSIEEPHLKDNVLAGAWMEVILGRPTYIVRREQDYGPARLGRMSFKLLDQRLTPIRLFVENDRLTSAILVDRASDLFADEFVVAMDHKDACRDWLLLWLGIGHKTGRLLCELKPFD